MRRKGIIAAAVLSVAVVLAAGLWLLTRPYAELRVIEREFGLKLPISARVTCSENTYNGWGDWYNGQQVVVCRLSKEQMAEVMAAARTHGWKPLPFVEEGVQETFAAHVQQERVEQVPWTLSQGMYKLKPTRESGKNLRFHPEAAAHYAQWEAEGKVYTLALGMIDPAENTLYLLRYDD